MTPIRTLTSFIVIAASLTLGACTTPVNPDTTLVAFSGKLSASEEVPAGNSTGTGTLKATFDTQSNTLKWTVTYSGLKSAWKRIRAAARVTDFRFHDFRHDFAVMNAARPPDGLGVVALGILLGATMLRFRALVAFEATSDPHGFDRRD